MRKEVEKRVKYFGLSFLIFVIFLIPIFSSGVNNSDSTSTSEWLMFHRTLNHTSWDGINYTVIGGLNNANFTTGFSISSSPAITNGYVYVGSNDNNLYQLNASNVSQQIANFTTPAGGASSPAIANGYVYVGSSNYLYQLNASNVSQQIANFTAGNSVTDSFPAVANGYVYVGSYDKNFYQLNASNISIQVANFTTGGLIYSSPAIANGYVYIGSNDNKTYQLNASNVSRQIANFATKNSIGHSSPAIANGYVYIGSLDHNLYQLNASNVSQQIANFTTGATVFSSPAVANNYVYIGSEDDNFYQLNASNVSQQIANFTVGATVFSSPAVANGYVYTGADDNKIYQLNASNISQKIANYTILAGGASSPAVGNGYVYVGSNDYNLYQLNASNISLRNNFSDTSYPQFSGYWDDNGSLVGSGTATFNVNVTNTNGTVFLQINNMNYTASTTQSSSAGVTRTGSVGLIQSSLDSSSQNITVPADATLIVVFANGYKATPGIFSGASLTLNGFSFSVARADDSNPALPYAGIFYLINPATGSQNFSWDWGSTGDLVEGANIYYTFYKGVNTSSPIKSSSGNQDYIGGVHVYSTAELNASSGDMAVAIGSAWGGSSSTSWANATKISDNIYNSESSSYAEANTTGNITLVLTRGGDTDDTGAISAIILRASSSSSGSSLGVYNVSVSSLTTGIYNYTWLSWGNGTSHNYNISNTRSYTVNSSGDTSYPTFSNYWDNNAALNNSGTGKFNVTLANTNGTVLLNINGANVTAKNMTANVYNASYGFSSSGIYSYKWYSWGNGSSNNFNVSDTRSYTVNGSGDTTPPNINFTAPTPANGSSQNSTSVYVNVSSYDVNNYSAWIDWNRSLVGYWSMDSVLVNGTVYDNSTHSNNGQMTDFNFNTTVTGIRGQGLNFSGTAGVIVLPASNNFISSDNQPFTFSAWIYPRIIGGGWPSNIILETNKEAYSVNALIGVGGGGYLAFNNGSDISGWGTTPGISENAWSFISVTYNGSCVQKYVNSQPTSDGCNPTSILAGSSIVSAYIGRDISDSAWFDGLIDEVMVWNRALSSQEINASYNAGTYKLYNNFTGLNNNTIYQYKAYAVDLSGNVNSTETRSITIGAPDTIYPQFSGYWDNNGTQITGGKGYFNVTLSSTNGTVLLNINGVNVTAKNITANVYNASYSFSSAGTYSYKWYSWGNGTLNNYNVSDTRSYIVNSTISGYYFTNFPLTENPISENGNWTNGKTDGLNWSDVQTNGSLAFGTQTGNGGYDDSEAILKGTWNPNQTAQATVYTVNQTQSYYQEVELRLRSSIIPYNSTGYEIDIRALNVSGRFVQIVRWNGPFDNFTYLNSVEGPGLNNGDVIKATIIGNTITVYINNIPILTVNDSTYTSGNPGIGFFNNDALGNSDFGFINFTASDITGVEYPQFSGYWDNNGTQITGGTGYFNVTLLNTNGTVRLTYNNTNYTASNNSGSSTTFNVTIIGLTNGTYPYNWSSYGNGTSHNYNISNTRSYTVNATSDTTYPQFSTYWDNNGTQITGGKGYFNVTLANTNGTVFLTFNNQNYTASNNSGNSTIFNATISSITSGTYNYYWISWGNGSSNNFNVSDTRSYSVNATSDTTYPKFSTYWDNNAALNNSGTGKFNVTLANTNGTVLLNINGVNVTAKNLTANVYNASYSFSSGGIYSYKWYSWGNGSSNNFNVSDTRSYIVNGTDIIPPAINFTNPTPANGSSQNSTSVYVNVSSSDASDHSAWIDWNRSLVGYWSFDSYNASGIYDNSTWNNFGNFMGGLGTGNITTGIRGKGLQFSDTTGDYLNTTTNFNLTANFTISAWINSTAYYNYIIMQDTGQGSKWAFSGDSFWTNALGWQGSGLTTGLWYYVTAVGNGTNITMYANGVQYQVIPEDNTTWYNNVPLYISAPTTYNTFNGTIDELMIFSRALSAQEIKALYNASANQYYNNFANLNSNVSYTYQAYAIDAAGNTNKTETRSVTIGTPDTSYPTFSNYWDNNGTLVTSGTGKFNVTLANTNGTVLLNINGANVTAKNMTANVYNASYSFSSGGIYSYKWYSWGNGSSNNFNVSDTRSYIVNSTTSQISGYYFTDFPLTENPISEGGNWTNGKADGIDWYNTVTTSGLAIGENSPEAYSDPTAILKGTWNQNQTAEASVYTVNQNPSYYQEIELRLRSNITAHNITGYEVLFRCTHDGSQYVQIVKWNGPLGNFTYIETTTGPGIYNGDFVKATIVGNNITAYINGAIVLSGIDNNFTKGNPGIGFDYGCGTTYPDFGFTNFTASDIPSSIGTSVNNCTPLSTANTLYTLTNNVTSNSTCFTINAANITLDCQGYNINYSQNGSAYTYGVYTNQINTTIKNCNIYDGNWTSQDGTRNGINYAAGSDNGTLINNNVNVSTGYGIRIVESSNNNLTSNTFTSNSSLGIGLIYSYNNTLINNTAITNWGTDAFQLFYSVGNKIYNQRAEARFVYGSVGLSFFMSNNTLVQDCVNISGTIDDVYYYNNGNVNNTFLNCSYNTSKEYIYPSTGSSLIREWYYRAYVNDTNGNPVANVNITAFNSTNNYQFNMTTNSSGYTPITQIIDYVNNGTIYYYSNYNMTATNTTSIANHMYNVTSNQSNLKDVFTITAPDTSYPQFSTYWDNNGTQITGGKGYFNVTLLSTNGTVILTFNNANYTASNNSGSSTTFNVTISSLIGGAYSYNWSSYGNGTSHNYNISNTRSYTINNSDTSYPTFSNYWDNNAALNNSGIGKFNVTLANTNGTVLLNINGANVTAKNLTATVYNASYSFSSGGIYSYKWYSWGNGTNNNFNVSDTRSYIVNGTDTTPPNINFTSPTPSNGSSQNSTSVYVNVSTSDASDHSVWLDWNRSLVGYWSMDSYNASGIYDNSTWGRFGNFTGGLGTGNIKTGIRGKGLQFDGKNDYVTVGTGSDFSDICANNSAADGVQGCSFSAWINLNQTGNYSDILDRFGFQRSFFDLVVEYTRFVFSIDTDGLTQDNCKAVNYGESALTANTWYQVTGVYNLTDTLLYVNGELIDTTTCSFSSINQTAWQNPQNTYIGGDDTLTYPLNGSIDEVMIWKKALSPVEIKALYNASANQYYNNFANLNSNVSYTYQAYAIDAAGNTNKTETRSVTIGTPDTSYPTFSNYWDNNGTLVTSGTGKFNVTLANTNGTVWITFNNTNYTASNSSGNATTFNATVPSITSGTYNYYWISWGNGTSNNYNISNTRSYTVNVTPDTINPSISIVYPTNNTNTTKTQLNVNYTVSDNVAVGSCWYSNDSYSINTSLGTNCANITTVTWSQGIHNVIVYVNDTSGNQNSSKVTFLVDNIAPNINIIYPSNNTNTTNTQINVNYTVSDSGIGISSCWYSNSSGIVNYSLANCGTNITGRIWLQGINNVTIWVNDSVGNQNSSRVTFLVDTIPPYFITLTNQTLPSNKSLSYSISAADAGVGLGTFAINWTNTFSIVPSTGVLTNTSGLGIGNYYINVSVNDTLGNMNSSILLINVTLTSDVTPPYFTAIPANTSINYTQGFGVDFNATDETGFGAFAINSTTLFSINSSGWFANSTSNIAVGNYYINVTISDIYNNLNSTIYWVNVSKAIPILGLSATTPITYTIATDFLGSGCPSQLSCSLNISNGVYNVGVINANYSTAGNSNYTSTSAVFGVTINQNTTYVLGISGTTPITYGTTTDVAGSGCPSQLNCSLNQSNIIYPAGTQTFNYSTVGNTNYSVKSITKTITINQAPSQTSLTFDKTSPQVYGTAITPTCSLITGVGSVALTNGTSGSSITLGVGNWTFNCSYVGNTNYTASSNFTLFNITKANPTFTYFINSQTNNISIVYPQQVNASAYTTGGTIFIYRDNADKTSENGLNVSLAVGNYTYIFNATGNANYSDVSSKTITVNISTALDITNPQISIIYPTNNTNTTNTQLNINYTVSDNVAVGSCWYSNSSGKMNYTLSSCANITGRTWLQGINNVTIWVNDTSGNQNNSRVTFTVDTIAPYFTNLANQTLLQGQSLNYQINASDTGVGVGSFAINWTNIFSIAATTGVLTNSSNLGVGDYYINVSVNDTLGNLNSSVLLVNVSLAADISYSQFSNYWDNNGSLITSGTGKFNVTLANTNGTVWLTFNNANYSTSNNSGNSTTFNVSIPSISSGTYNYYWVSWGNGTSHNYNISNTRSYTVNATETIAPNILVIYPTNNTNTTNTQLNINYTVSDNVAVGSCWYSNTSGIINYTLISCANITGRTWLQGINNIIIWVNDSSNNVNSSRVTFAVDNIVPYFTNLANQSLLQGQSLNYDIDAADSGVGLGSFAINWTNTFSIVPSTGVLTNTSGLSIGNYYINVSVNDTLGNMNSSILLINVSGDIIAPIVSLVSPANASTWTSDSTVTFTYNVTDSNDILNCSLIINEILDQTVGSVTKDISQTFTKSMSNADYIWSVNCTDAANNQGNSSFSYLTLSYTAPTTPPGGGGGGGGGGSGTTTQNNQTGGTTQIISGSPSHTIEIEINQPPLDLIKLMISVIKTISGVPLTVTQIDNIQAQTGTGLPVGQPYQTFTVNTTLNNSDIETVLLIFRINKTWLSNQNGTAENLKLYRQPSGDNQWSPLTTTFIGNDSQYYFFTSISQGFSTFVMFLGKYECQPGIKRCFNSQSQMCLGNSTWLITEKCVFGCDQGGKCLTIAPQSPRIYSILIVILSVSIILTFLSIIFRIRERRKNKPF